MRINNNVSAINTHRSYTINNNAQAKSLEKLSSGYRINRAGDDAAGLAISEKMRGQIRGLNQASRNASDGISLIQTAEGALNETHAILQRMRELAVQSASDTNNTTDRAKLEKELTQLRSEIDRISTDTEFNQNSLLDGTLTNKKLHIGANANQNIAISIGTLSASALTVTANTITISAGSAGSQQATSNTLITTVDAAISKVSDARADLGAIQNRLEHTIKNLDVASENLQASESRIRDVDMAKEMMEFTKQNILSQAATSMLAQANQAPQGVLQLLR